MVGDGQDLDGSGGKTIGDGVGKATENVATEPIPRGPAFGPARDQVRGGAHGAREFVAQAWTLFFVPENGVMEIGLGCCREANRYPIAGHGESAVRLRLPRRRVRQVSNQPGQGVVPDTWPGGA